MSDAPERVWLTENEYHLEYLPVDSELSLDNCVEYVRADLCEKPKMPQPDWNDAPEWANYHAYNCEGYGIWFADAPHRTAGNWSTGYRKSAESNVEKLPLGIDWRQTLQRRPEADDGE